MTRPDGSAPWVIWGGALPSGSLKYLTFERYLEAVGRGAFAQGLIEISEGCTAWALQRLASQAKVPLIVLCSAAGAASLRARGFRAETQVVTSFADALQICAHKQQDGWHWPQQMRNPMLIEAVRGWASQVVELLGTQPKIDTVVCGFGTGATVVGLESMLGPLGYKVLALQSPAGCSVAGWRNFSEQNLGDTDVFHPHAQRIELHAAHAHKGEASSALRLLLSHDWQVAPERLCVISHDGLPSAGIKQER